MIMVRIGSLQVVCETKDDLADMPHLGAGSLDEFPPRRDVEKQIPYLDGCADVDRNAGDDSRGPGDQAHLVRCLDGPGVAGDLGYGAGHDRRCSDDAGR